MLDSVGLAPPGGVGVGKDVSRLAWCDPPVSSDVSIQDTSRH